MATLRFWYKILDDAPPKPLPRTLPLSPLDARDDFIHLSVASQIPITAGKFFSTSSNLWVLKIQREKLVGRFEFPPPYGEACPHLHDSEEGLGSNNVVDVIEMRRAATGEWKDVPAMAELEN
nr:hypothetical protein B0A51_06200 [Rachicladosporium sp. CCFEE 5018]